MKPADDLPRAAAPSPDPRALLRRAREAYEQGRWDEVLVATLALPDRALGALSVAARARYARAWQRAWFVSHRLDGLPVEALAAALAPDASWVCAADRRGTLARWDLGPHGAPTRGPIAPRWTASFGAPVHGLACAPDGATLLACGDSRPVLCLYDAATGAQRAVITGGSSYGRGVACLPGDPARAVSAHYRGIEVWDLAQNAHVRAIEVAGAEPTDVITAMALTPDGRVAVCGTMNGTLLGIDLESGARTFTVGGVRSMVRDIAIGPDGTCALVARHDTLATLHDLPGGAERVPPLQHPVSCTGGVAVTPCGRFGLATIGGCANLFELDTGVRLHTFDGPGRGRIVIARDASRVAVAGDWGRDGPGGLRVWDLPCGILARAPSA